MKIRLILLSMVVLMCAPYSTAQLWKMKRYEVTAGLGTSQFYGDIGGFTIGKNAMGLKDITFRQTMFNVNGAFRYFIIDNVSARFSFTYAMLHATDARGSNEGRGYESFTSLFEPSLTGEYYFVRNRERNSFLFQTHRSIRRSRLKDFMNSIDGYAFTGIGGAGYDVFRRNEKFSTEKPETKTGGFTAVIPLGIGAKLTLDPNILVGVELAARYAFSDYLDGYTSKWSARNDVYHTFSFTFNYRIRAARNGLPSFRFSSL
jgi:hypothetical protein